MTMTIDELIAEMPKDGWTCREGSGMLRRQQNGRMCCPITSGVRGHSPETCWAYRNIAKSLGMSVEDAVRVAASADDDKSSTSFDPALRARLLAAVGLKEPT